MSKFPPMLGVPGAMCPLWSSHLILGGCDIPKWPGDERRADWGGEMVVGSKRGCSVSATANPAASCQVWHIITLHTGGGRVWDWSWPCWLHLGWKWQNKISGLWYSEGINREQMNYSVKSVDSWVTIWRKKINQSWIYASQPNSRQIRDLI